MKVAKPTDKMISGVNDFVHACENVLEQEKFSMRSPYEKWEEWDDEDEDKILIKKIRKAVAEEEGIDEDRVDGRILAYEFLRRKYNNRLSHITMTAHILLDNCCDPMDDCLAFHPSLYQNHVAPEQ